jgi:hypothetical protein
MRWIFRLDYLNLLDGSENLVQVEYAKHLLLGSDLGDAQAEFCAPTMVQIMRPPGVCGTSTIL